MLPVTSLTLALTLAAAAPAPVAAARPPVAPKSSPATILVRSPKAGLPDLRAFLAEAGQWSAMLRPVELGKSLGAVLGADILDPAALSEAGVDAEAPMSVSFLREATVVCLSTVKGSKTIERARTTLAGSGQPAKQAYKGAQLEGAVAGKIWRAGVATKGSALCFASGGTDALAALKEAVDALGGQGLATTAAVKAAAGLDAPVMGYFQAAGEGGAFEVRATKGALELVGRAVLGSQPLDKPKEGDVLAGLAVEAPMALRAQLTPKAMADPGSPGASVLSFLASNACKACDAATSQAVLAALKPEVDRRGRGAGRWDRCRGRAAEAGGVLPVPPRLRPSGEGGGQGTRRARGSAQEARGQGSEARQARGRGRRRLVGGGGRSRSAVGGREGCALHRQ
ncbi:MAG: hypothetical protein QM765_09475 [Myxococcales bacterium]